ncbi:chitin binding peritrophin-A domain-containing protein [Streptomyces griseus]|uniref:chitin binding peritrophin-A domain-containing protein n=1 Tax=Streptomyces griseus TaxID=1911 RepID=UPI003792165D
MLTGDDYYVHPDHCSKFIQCTNGVAHVMDCPEGMNFNPNVRPGPVCDLPRDYPCIDD